MNNYTPHTSRKQAAQANLEVPIEDSAEQFSGGSLNGQDPISTISEVAGDASAVPSPSGAGSTGTQSALGAGETTPGFRQKQMIMAAAVSAEYWHDPDGEAFASIEMNGRRSHLKVRSKDYKNFLCWFVYRDFFVTPSSQSLEDVIRAMEGLAKYESPEYTTCVRIAGDDSTSFIDLANENANVFEVSGAGVTDASDASDARFRLTKKPGMRPLPMPILPSTIDEAVGSLRELREFCNVSDDFEWLLFLVAMLSALRPNGPFVIVLIVGEQGSSKSTLCRVFRRLIDPSKTPLRSAPKDERDLLIAACNSWILIFDNVSKLSADMSDALCRLATGGGSSYRTLYENDAETMFEAQRLVILNTIDDLPLRGDIVDRSIQINCKRIDESNRLPESEFWSRFDEMESKFFGALLFLLSLTLKQLPDVKLKRSPRMADFSRFGVAVEKALDLPEGTFLDAYENNRKGMAAVALEGQLTQVLLMQQLPLHLSASDLWERLNNCVCNQISGVPRWFPRNAQQLSSHLRRIAPFLREKGIQIEFNKSESRVISITALSP